jgi:hypothetical protein
MHVRGLFAALLVAVFWAAPLLASAQATLGPVETYRSPEFGYALWWDAGEWAIQDQAAEPGSDWLQLGNGITGIDVWGYAAPGATAESCMAYRLEQAQGYANLARYESLTEPGLAPAIGVSSDGLTAWSEMVLAFETEARRETFAVSDACTTIVPGERMLVTSKWLPGETYNAHIDQGLLDLFDAERVLATLTMPRSAWSFSASDPIAIGPQMPNLFVQPKLLVTPGGAEQAMFTTYVPNCVLTHPASMPVVVIENTGGAPLAVSPEAFFVIEGEVELLAEGTQWIMPALGSAGAVTLMPGEVGVLRFQYPLNDGTLYYADASGVPLELEYLGPCFGGGGALPVKIDME